MAAPDNDGKRSLAGERWKNKKTRPSHPRDEAGQRPGTRLQINSTCKYTCLNPLEPFFLIN